MPRQRGLGFPESGAVSHLVWVLGTELESSARAVCALTAEPSLQPFGTSIEGDE